jgi:hypothetical protein
MKKIKPTSAFAGVNLSCTPPHIMVWTISGAAKNVRKEVGEAWDYRDPANGWKSAKAEGVRVRRVEVKLR